MDTGLHDCRRLDSETLDTRQVICSVQRHDGNDFRDLGDFSCIIFIDRTTEIATWVQIKGDLILQKTDHVIISRCLYVVEELVDKTAKIVKDALESQLLKFQDMGVSIEKGIKVPVNEALTPEDMHFVNQWVGIWTKNIAENYHKLKKGKSIKDLKDICKNVPAVIVGAGPSLDKNIDELKDINAIIISTDRAYKALLARNIVPDLIVSVDCHDDLILNYLDKVDNTEHILVLNSAADYNITRQWKGKTLFFNMGHAGIQFCDKVLPYLFPNFMAVANVGCVANTAVIIANWIGCSDIILAGCDFSYPDDKMHCDKYDFIDGEFKKIDVDWKEIFEKRSGKIKKNGIYTYPPYIDYERTMKVLEQSQKLHIINATEGGIIDGFPMMTLKGAKFRYCGKSILDAKYKLKQEV